MGPYVAIFELILVFGGVFAFGFHQLWSLRRDRLRREAAKREAAAAEERPCPASSGF